ARTRPAAATQALTGCPAQAAMGTTRRRTAHSTGLLRLKIQGLMPRWHQRAAWHLTTVFCPCDRVEFWDHPGFAV
ncbi:MAG: hypothetical protein QE285_17385, partial [Aquabacterium sp.]|nr:hypothetical protein [Aquabacterium sp.]